MRKTILLFNFLFLLSFVTSDICVENEVDIYQGFDDSMTTGSIMNYGMNALLIAARNNDGFHLFSYTREREEKLQIVKTFSHASNFYHVGPFLDVFSDENAAIYQVYDSVSLYNFSVFYTYGELDDMNTVHIKVQPRYGVTGILEFDGYYFGWSTMRTVYLIDLITGDADDITPEGCDYPLSMRTFFNNEVLALLCANSTTYSWSTVVDLFLLDTGSVDMNFEKYNKTDTTEFQFSTNMNNFIEFEGEIFYYNLNGVSSTNLVTDEVVFDNNNNPTSLMKLGNRLILQSFAEFFPNALFQYSLLSDPENALFTLGKPIDEFFIHENIAYFGADCDDNVYYHDVLCMLDLDTLSLSYVEDSTANGMSGFFLNNGVIYFTARDPNLGTELFYINSDNEVHLAADIYRGRRSGRPTDFIFMDDDIYFISANIYYGREIFTFVEKDDCGDGTEVVYCGIGESQCVITSSGNVTYVGDITLNMTSIFQWTNTIEGNLFAQNATLSINGTTNVLGSVTLSNTSVLSISSSDVLNVRECINTGDGVLEIRLTEEELSQGRVQILQGACFRGSFSEIRSADPCQEITVTESDYNTDLSVVFTSTNVCTKYTIIIIVSVIAVLVIAIAFIIIIIKVSSARKAILPHRDRGQAKNRHTIHNSTDKNKQTKIKRGSDSDTPRKTSGSNTSMA